MKLYTTPGACSLADHIVLEWIGEPYEAVIVSKEERGLPAYLAINPNGAVPALDDGGWVLTQNAAILNYLADLYPASGLGGDGSPRSRAEINKWLAFVNSDVHPAFKPLFGSTSYLDEAAAIEKSKGDARRKLRDLFAKADAQLAGKDSLTGARSIADPYLYVVLRWARASEVDLSGFENLDRFMRAMRADAGVKKAMKAEGLA